MNKQNIILSHSGKQHSYYVAETLKSLGFLKYFYTSSYITSPFIQDIVSKNGLQFWNRRFISGLGSPEVKASWGYEVKEILYRKLGKPSFEITKLVYERDEKFDNNLAGKLSSLPFDIFWGFQGSSLNCIEKANALGKTSVCEMTIAHLPYAKRILDEEVRLHPEWADSIDFANFPASYEKRLIEEPLKAQKVIAISSFLKKTLVEEGVPENKVTVIPLGFDLNAVKYNESSEGISNRPLRLLYAGRITQRKGMQYLLDAMKLFDRRDVDLHVIGNIHGSGKAFKNQSELYQYSPGISQMEIFQQYSNYDALIFPSILEGFGLVAIEAMGAGLPVISTPHTNATEILKDGFNGYCIPIRDSHAIAQSIEKLRNMGNDAFHQMRLNARETALKFTWEAYKNNVASFLHQF